MFANFTTRALCGLVAGRNGTAIPTRPCFQELCTLAPRTRSEKMRVGALLCGMVFGNWARIPALTTLPNDVISAEPMKTRSDRAFFDRRALLFKRPDDLDTLETGAVEDNVANQRHRAALARIDLRVVGVNGRDQHGVRDGSLRHKGGNGIAPTTRIAFAFGVFKKTGNLLASATAHGFKPPLENQTIHPRSTIRSFGHVKAEKIGCP